MAIKMPSMIQYSLAFVAIILTTSLVVLGQDDLVCFKQETCQSCVETKRNTTKVGNNGTTCIYELTRTGSRCVDTVVISEDLIQMIDTVDGCKPLPTPAPESTLTTTTTPVPSTVTTATTSANVNYTTWAPTPTPTPRKCGFAWGEFTGGFAFAIAVSFLGYLIWRFGIIHGINNAIKTLLRPNVTIAE